MTNTATQHDSKNTLKAINSINPTGAKAFYASVSEATSGSTAAHNALHGMMPSITQYVLAIKAAQPNVTKIDLQVSLDLPQQGANETPEEYTARVMAVILSSLTSGGVNTYTDKTQGRKLSDWERQVNGVGIGVVAAKLSLTRIEKIDGLDVPKTYRSLIGDEVAFRSVTQYHKELRAIAKGKDEKPQVKTIAPHVREAAVQEKLAELASLPEPAD